MSFRTVTKPHMKKTVVTTVRARPVFRGAVSVAVLVMGRFMGSRASITDFADPGTDRSVPKARFWPRGGVPSGPGRDGFAAAAPASGRQAFGWRAISTHA